MLHDDAPVVTAPYVDAGTGKLVVTFAVPVKDNGTLKAVVAGDVTMDSVVANVREIHPTPASSGLLLDSDGSVIAASDPALTLKPFNDAISGVDLHALTAGKTVQGSLGGQDKIFSAVPVKGTHWLLVVALDHQDATSGMNALLKASAIAFIVLVLVGGGVVHLLVATMLKRLITIRDAMLAISNGTNDLSQRLPENGKDEVAQIAHAFNLFSDKLAQVMRQLRDSTSSVQTAAQEIAAGNRDLSARTEQAASSLRETASAVEQISASVAQSTESATAASAQAAKEIKTLIDSTTQSVATGSHFVRLAGESMQEIVSNIGSVSGIIREISIASSEQMQGIKEINHAVIHLDRMVQQNTELVVESAAAAGALQSQAGDLATTAGHFRI